MALSSLRQLPELHNERRDGDVARGYFRNLKVDVLLTSNPVFEEVRKCHAVMQRFVEQDIPCATVERLILLKLMLFRRYTGKGTSYVSGFTRTT